MTAEQRAEAKDVLLSGIRVIEVGDELTAYAGRLLAGMGADVVVVEPPGGSPTRGYGPFYQDQAGPERSLFWWHYGLGKRSVVLDLESERGQADFARLAASADVVLESTPRGTLDDLPGSVVRARVTAFGDDGPWAGYRGSDLIHLALGGPMVNCGYDPEPDGRYDTPPIAPQMWHAYHIAGEQVCMNIIAALIDRERHGRVQSLHCAVHDAVSKNTELDLMNWIYRAARFYRQTCRHAAERVTPLPSIGATKDGRWVMALARGRSRALIDFLDQYDAAADLGDEAPEAGGAGTRSRGEAAAHILEVSQRLIRRFHFDGAPWREAQEAGQLWAPLRKPHENALDDHWRERGSFQSVAHPEHDAEFTYTASKWVSNETAWKAGPRAPLIGEHTEEILNALPDAVPAAQAPARHAVQDAPGIGEYPLAGVRILDFTWWLASGGAPRYLSALGAEDIKVEWHENLDLRMGMAQYGIGGREARASATAPLRQDLSTINLSGQFNDFHAGQRGISLNLRHPEGLALAKRLVEISDIVAEGFSPGVMERWGLGYEVMREIKPDIIYLSQSGMGQVGIYGRYRTVGPIAASMAGVSEMSGLPEPYAPAGWGYSYLDWFGAYNLANAMMAALWYRDRTGKGQWIDSSQVDAGIYLNGTAVLDWSANGREWQRYGNRSPYKPAAPHGAYRCRDDLGNANPLDDSNDRWIAIACFTDAEWQALVEEAGSPEWTRDPKFATLADRLANQDELDQHIESWTRQHDRYDLMHRLQARGIPAGVCQDAQDRYERDPQLAHLNWLTEVDHTEMGTWPTREVPVKWNRTPPTMRGVTNRGAPCYGEDNRYVYGELLGLGSREIDRLAEEGIIAEGLTSV